MALITQSDLENALTPATVTAIFDDTGDGTINSAAITLVISRAEGMVYSFIARNLSSELPLTQSPPPATLVSAALEFAIVYCRDRKPEYWSKTQENEREFRLKEAFKMMERFADAKQQAYDLTDEPKPVNVGGITYTGGPRTIIDSLDGTENGSGF